LNNVFSIITNKLKGKPNKFSVQELDLYIESINRGNDEFSEAIRFQNIIKKINIKSDEKFADLLKQYQSVINTNNSIFYFEEIVKEVSESIIREEIEHGEERDRFFKKLITPNISQNNDNPISKEPLINLGGRSISDYNQKDLPEISYIENKAYISSISSQNKAFINDMLAFHYQDIGSYYKIIRTDGHTGIMANLKNGERFLIHKNLNGEVIATDAYFLSNNWKINGEAKYLGMFEKLKITDMIENAELDKYLNNNKITPQEYESMKISNNKNQISNLNSMALSAGFGFLGSVIANIIIGQYKCKSG